MMENSSMMVVVLDILSFAVLVLCICKYFAIYNISYIISFLSVMYSGKIKSQFIWCVLGMVFFGLIFTISCLPWNEKGDPLYFPVLRNSRHLLFMKRMVIYGYAFMLLFSFHNMMEAIMNREPEFTCKLNVIRTVLVILAACIVTIGENFIYNGDDGLDLTFIVSHFKCY